MSVSVVRSDAGEVAHGGERRRVPELRLDRGEWDAAMVEVVGVGVAEAVGVDALAKIDVRREPSQHRSDVARVERGACFAELDLAEVAIALNLKPSTVCALLQQSRVVTRW